MIWCLPGFLGRATDWSAFAKSCTQRGLPPVEPYELFNGSLSGSLVAWAHDFNRHVAARDPAPLLVGYSLGGRLALHALLDAPALWQGAVIVAAHCGLDDAEQRAARVREDDAWTQRFAHEHWGGLMRAWNARPVFSGRPQTLERPAAAFERAALAHGLRAFGLGQQEPLAPRLTEVLCPVLWVAGALDRPFLAEAERAMQYLPHGALAVAPGAAHRVPWEAPEWFHTSAGAFLQSLT
jgi:2-succinyl-6-hydroxy-2,4-cyclohexadiene-1-carboxylate synthase